MPQMALEKRAITAYAALDSGNSGSEKNECHSASQTCNSVLTPAWRQHFVETRAFAERHIARP